MEFPDETRQAEKKKETEIEHKKNLLWAEFICFGFMKGSPNCI